MQSILGQISRVDFGRFDAESDQNLRDYFVDTGSFKRLLEGQRQFVIGRKGAGKTAIFRQAQATLRDQSNVPVPIEFSDYAWENHKAVKELGCTAEDTYKSSWVFTFLMAACCAWRRSRHSHVRREACDIYQQIYGDEDVGTLNLLFDKLRRIRRLDLPKINGLGSLGGIELEKAPDGNHLARTANVWNQALMDLAKRVIHHEHTSILVDRLDDGWDASAESKAMLAGALKAAREVNLKLNLPNRPSTVVIFLRADIFKALEFNDKNKIAQDIEYLDWDEKSLLEILNARISRSLGIQRSKAWDLVFSSKEMRQRASIRSYLLKRTMKRPRDIVAFATFCKDAAVKAGHRVVETTDVYDAEKRYTKHIYDELVDEMHKQVPDHALMFQVINRVGYSRFRFVEWMEAVTKARAGADETTGREFLKTLFEYGVIGTPKVGGHGGGSAVEYVYEDRFNEPAFDGEIVVHPALHAHLQIKDRRAYGPEDEADPESGAY
jgi:hypothetical protein